MDEKLVPGIKAEKSIIVEEKHLASRVGSGLVSVFSTAMMVAGMEEAAVAAVQPFLEEGWTTVGVHVNVSHEAATPPGMRVRFLAELLEISSNGRKFRFHVEAHDEAGLIGQGEHGRIAVERERFERRTMEKGAPAKKD